MHRLPTEQQLLNSVQAAIILGLAFRMWYLGLYRVYVYFFGYLILVLCQTLVPQFLPFDSVGYRNAWLATEALIVCFYLLVVLELYSIVFQDLAGIENLSRRYIKVALGIAIGISLTLLGVEKNRGGMVAHLLTFERAVVFSLVLFVLLVTGFLVYYPVPLKRNIIVYSAGYTVYFTGKAGSILIYNAGYYWNRVMSNVWIGASLLCLLFWLSFLNRAGETKKAKMAHQWSEADEERLLSQLNGINTSLLRAARK